MFFIISYDLKGGGSDYTELYEAIKSVGEWQHPLESTWVVKTDLDQNQIYDRLKTALDDVDHVLIFQIYPKERLGWLAKSFWAWMREKVEEEES